MEVLIFQDPVDARGVVMEGNIAVQDCNTKLTAPGEEWCNVFAPLGAVLTGLVGRQDEERFDETWYIGLGTAEGVADIIRKQF